MEPVALERAVRGAKQMFPEATVKVRRGRVLAVDGDVIRFIVHVDLDSDPSVAK
jgi:hypothetical protein